MAQQALKIYYRKKYLKQSFLRYFFSLLAWFGMYYFAVFHSGLAKLLSLELNGILIFVLFLTLIFGVLVVKFFRFVWGCVTEYKGAPKIAYALNEDGVIFIRADRFIPWSDIHGMIPRAYNEGFYFRITNRTICSLDSWGIDPEEMKQAKAFIKTKLPDDKTKKLK